jgi:hypothetical protein
MTDEEKQTVFNFVEMSKRNDIHPERLHSLKVAVYNLAQQYGVSTKNGGKVLTVDNLQVAVTPSGESSNILYLYKELSL